MCIVYIRGLLKILIYPSQRKLLVSQWREPSGARGINDEKEKTQSPK